MYVPYKGKQNGSEGNSDSEGEEERHRREEESPPMDPGRVMEGEKFDDPMEIMRALSVHRRGRPHTGKPMLHVIIREISTFPFSKAMVDRLKNYKAVEWAAISLYSPDLMKSIDDMKNFVLYVRINTDGNLYFYIRRLPFSSIPVAIDSLDSLASELKSFLEYPPDTMINFVSIDELEALGLYNTEEIQRMREESKRFFKQGESAYEMTGTFMGRLNFRNPLWEAIETKGYYLSIFGAPRQKYNATPDKSEFLRKEARGIFLSLRYHRPEVVSRYTEF